MNKRYIYCWNCQEKLGRRPVDCYWWCNEQCRAEHEKTRTEKRKEARKNHFPLERNPLTEQEIHLMGMKVATEPTLNPLEELVHEVQEIAKNRKKTKGKRRCGKCGEVGHNARTCGR